MSHDCKTYEFKCTHHHRPVFLSVTVPVGGGVEFMAPTGLVTCPYCHTAMTPDGVGDSRKLRPLPTPLTQAHDSTPETRTCLRLFKQALGKGDESLYEPAIVKCVQSLVADAGFTIRDAAFLTWSAEPATVNRVLDRIDTRFPITSPELRTIHEETRGKS